MDLRSAIKLLEANRPPLLKSDKQVDLSSKQIGDTDATALFRAALKNHTVTTINVSYNELSPESAQAIRQMLISNNTLTHLNLSGNDLGDEGALVVLDGLHANTTLRTLELSDNGVGEQTICLLKKVVGREQPWGDCRLQSLALSKNDFGCPAATTFVEGLRSPRVLLKTLNLSHNCLDDTVAVALGQMLSHNSTLTNLTLNVSDIGQDGLLAIGKGLDQNVTLTALDLRDSEATDRQSIELFFEAIGHNTTLGTLTLKCHLTPSDDAALDRCMGDRNQRISAARKASRNIRRPPSAWKEGDFDPDALFDSPRSPRGADASGRLSPLNSPPLTPKGLPDSPDAESLLNLDSSRRATGGTVPQALSGRKRRESDNDYSGFTISPRKEPYKPDVPTISCPPPLAAPAATRMISASELASRFTASQQRPPSPAKLSAALTEPPRPSSPMLPATPATPGEIRVFCSLAGQASSKVIVAQRTDSFDTFRAAVQEKLHATVHMTFKDEDGDEVDLDSEESWQMLVRLDVRKFRVTCTKLG